MKHHYGQHWVVQGPLYSPVSSETPFWRFFGYGGDASDFASEAEVFAHAAYYDTREHDQWKRVVYVRPEEWPIRLERKQNGSFDYRLSRFRAAHYRAS